MGTTRPCSGVQAALNDSSIVEVLWSLKGSLPSEPASWDCSASLLLNTLSSVCRLQHTCHSMLPVWSHLINYSIIELTRTSQLLHL